MRNGSFKICSKDGRCQVSKKVRWPSPQRITSILGYCYCNLERPDRTFCLILFVKWLNGKKDEFTPSWKVQRIMDPGSWIIIHCSLDPDKSNGKTIKEFHSPFGFSICFYHHYRWSTHSIFVPKHVYLTDKLIPVLIINYVETWITIGCFPAELIKMKAWWQCMLSIAAEVIHILKPNLRTNNGDVLQEKFALPITIWIDFDKLMTLGRMDQNHFCWILRLQPLEAPNIVTLTLSDEIHKSSKNSSAE